MADEKVKILLVEDDIFMRKIYSDAFKLEGFDITAATNGQEGMLQVYRDIPDLILLDIMMPEMNGLEMLEKLKYDPKTKDIPVIMLTNLSGKTEAETALSKGAIQYLIKSENEPKQVVDIVRKALQT